MRGLLITGLVGALAVVMIVVERVKPGRLWPKVPGWWTRALLLDGVQIASVFLAGRTYDAWIGTHRPWSADGLGLWGGAAVGYVVHTFVYYWWHRFRHDVGPLWRWVHQVHHSPQRIEVITSFYKHPIELAINGVLSSVVLYAIVGLGPEAGTLAMVMNGVAELFYHWNVRTPVWLGYLVQRPESHCVHHQEGLHRHNYADLPVFDMMFGTFLNPKGWAGRCGFGDERSNRLGEMLAGRDVTREVTAPQ
jgi:sterol desaturase/sphingolipid hydroxylase (fatty acid hydroxylase superfamily)